MLETMYTGPTSSSNGLHYAAVKTVFNSQNTNTTALVKCIAAQTNNHAEFTA